MFEDGDVDGCLVGVVDGWRAEESPDGFLQFLAAVLWSGHTVATLQTADHFVRLEQCIRPGTFRTIGGHMETLPG